jgi:hypothetical protein
MMLIKELLQTPLKAREAKKGIRILRQSKTTSEYIFAILNEKDVFDLVKKVTEVRPGETQNGAFFIYESLSMLNVLLSTLHS